MSASEVKVALLVTAGTTPEPLIKSIKDLTEEYGGKLMVYVIYGRPFPGQSPDPFEQAQKVVEEAKRLGLEVLPMEASNPEDFIVSCRICDEAIADAVSKGVKKLICNYTGGTKVLSAALVHVALTRTPELIPIELYYVGGEKRDRSGRVLTPSMVSRREEKIYLEELLDRALTHAQKFNYGYACSILEGLQLEGKAKQIREILRALYYWDNFNYEEASKILKELTSFIEANLDDEKIGFICKLAGNFTKISGRLTYLVGMLRRAESSDTKALNEASKDPEGLILLCMDILENAKRRFLSGNYVDAVLRCYRAVEALTQAVLIVKYRFNPWKPNWQQLNQHLKAIKETFGEQLPSTVALKVGIKLIEVLEQRKLELEKELDPIMQIRNHSILEHGYQSPNKETAEKIIQLSKIVIDELRKLIKNY